MRSESFGHDNNDAFKSKEWKLNFWFDQLEIYTVSDDAVPESSRKRFRKKVDHAQRQQAQQQGQVQISTLKELLRQRTQGFGS